MTFWQILDNVGLLALLTVLWGALVRTEGWSPRLRKLAFGLTAGAVAGAMAVLPLLDGHGLEVDARAAPLVLAGVLEGWPAALVAGAVAAAARAALGGPMAWASCGVTALAALLGGVLGGTSAPAQQQADWRVPGKAIIATAVVSALWGSILWRRYALTPVEFPWTVAAMVAFSALAALAISRLMQQQYLRTEARRHVRRERVLREGLSEASPVGIVLLNPSCIVTYANPAACAVFGRTADELNGLHCKSLIHAEGGSFEPPCGAGEGTRGPFAVRRPDGTQREVRVACTALSTEEGTSEGLLLTVEDVTEQVSQQRRLERAARAMRLRAVVGRSFADMKTEHALMRAVCSAAVEQGGYVLAWAGIARPDGSVQVVARAGEQSDYLDAVEIRWDEGELGRGPTGTAIRSGQPVVCRDIPNDPRFEPWREQAIRRGYASSAAFPLKANGRVVGALNIYAPEPDAFDEEELRLLEGLADDLSVGLQAIRERQRHEQAERARREAEEMFRLVVENVQEGINVCHFDPATRARRLVFCNERFVEMSGRSREELEQAEDLNELVIDRGTPENCDRRVAEMLEGLPVRGLASWKRPDGKENFFEWVATPIRVGQKILLLGVDRDVTEQRRAQAQIEGLAELVRENPNPVLRVSCEGAILEANKAAETLLSELLSRPGGPLREEWLALVRKALQEQKPQERELAVGERTFLLHLVPVPERNYLNIYGRDITERLQLEERLNQAQRLEALGRLAGGIAHDFNNILTGLDGYLRFALEDIPPDSAGREDLKTAQTLVKRAENLVGQLLAFSRQRPADLLAVDLNKVIKRLTQMLKPLLGEQVELRFAPGEDLGLVMADPAQIEQVIMNLATNARDAMPDGGILTIETANVELGEHYATTHDEVPPGRYVTLAVSDTGHGMDAETLKRAFDPFFTTKPVDKGTGLGLSSVYGVVEQHKGHVHISSEPGRGTTVKIYLPRVEKPEHDRTTVYEFESLPRGSETVLVVEDEQAVLEVTRRLLTNLGYNVLCASDCRTARTVLEQNASQVALILTDLVLPDGKGSELGQWALERWPHLRILYMSGYPDEATSQQLSRQARGALLGKPFTPEQVALKIREALET